MLTIPAISSSSSSSLHLLRRNPRSRVSNIFCSSASSHESPPQSEHRPRGGHAGLRLDETVEAGSGRSRLDSWISFRFHGVSRARIQASIRSGLVAVNGRPVEKVSHIVRDGDRVCCTVSELQPLRAEPEDIPLDIVYEDSHVLVVNKPAHMVVHPAPGNANGTLVNAILHHCRLPTMSCTPHNSSSEVQEFSELSEDELDDFNVEPSSAVDISSSNYDAHIRPGIVHRLDKGTSGLLVVAKDEESHAHLAEQFKSHTIHRVYISLTSGVPSPSSGRIEVPIARDPNNRVRMAAVAGSINSKHVRYAASRYKVLEVLANGGSALVQWRLETGRTHQIRAHAKYLGIPLLGDEVYGGTKSMALSLLKPRTPSSCHGYLSHMISNLDRPCLHALSLGFKHPHTGEQVQFSCHPPADFSDALSLLRNINNVSSNNGEIYVENVSSI
ncbi:RNA pseudouridine synthase 2, chloroplastic isoform X1 [Dioscorea cayenensis subsp. rotundata]|uniref:RNA pseudouridine synthase 2, chloroplastic isoform X1 n=1 Tax=Dioscorea cayennensis subsp. rotundata TaxID=55577 RepID=A0AB40C201_DIOCR|nr:RNA pseudouridine synthase 2, chloroplastic isoform X1 [Dioscorea cayenensis subsp. rotundata]